ncbi:MAG TPA: ABC transporter ATP-binding protein [Microbacteriaceae bacterium]|nr:ABC transporter ATP-binding protein [Microbacteriaceae bacterium]
MTTPNTAKSKTPFIDGQNITVTFPARKTALFARKSYITALNDVSISVYKGQSLAIVGESGSGKSTLIKALFGLQRIDRGSVSFDGRPVLSKGRQRWLRARSGIIFQDPYSSLDPRMSIGASISEPLEALKIPGSHDALVQEILSKLELPEDTLSRYPDEFSGGQRQRIAIARALVHSPEVLVGDEPVSALDVLVRRRIIDLLATLRQEMGLTMISVTHDLGIVPDIAERVLVLQHGRVVEEGSVAQIFTDPQNSYTRSLITALPRIPKF